MNWLPGAVTAADQRPAVWRRLFLLSLVPVVCLAAATAVAGCDLRGLSNMTAQTTAGPAVTVTQDVAPSALVIVTDGTASGASLSNLVAATGRPREDLAIIAEQKAQPIIASTSAPPAEVVLPGKPAEPGSGATSYQTHLYLARLKTWQGQVASGRQRVVSLTRDAIERWVAGLDIPSRMTHLIRTPQNSNALVLECALGSNAITGIEQANPIAATRRVLLLYAANLRGIPPTGELNGDDVIVVVPFLPSVAAVNEAQQILLDSGAGQAAVLGPEITAAQLDNLISTGLTQKVSTDQVSTPVLFADNSDVLPSDAAEILMPLVSLLRHPGTFGVINGYASTPGTIQRNDRLALARAAAVAHFFEAHQVPSSSLLIVGHGGTDLFAPGPSGANRRVIVVIERS